MAREDEIINMDPLEFILLRMTETAYSEYKMLKLWGFIGLENEKWPINKHGRRYKALNQYCYASDVQELVDFFKDGWCERVFALRGIDVDTKQIMEVLEK